MQYTTTISSKGQIVIPKIIRDELKIIPSDNINVELINNQIIVTPVTSTESMLGSFKAKQSITKKDIKNIYKKAIIKKFA